MATSAISGVGVSFERGDGASSESFTAIAEVNSITGPSPTRDFIDCTSLDSDGGYREFIAGFRDGGDVSLNINYTRAGYEALKTDFETADSVNYQIVIPDDDTTTLSFAGLVTGIPLSITPDDKITIDCTIKISGQITLSS